VSTLAPLSIEALQALIDGSPFTAGLGFVVIGAAPEADEVRLRIEPCEAALRMRGTSQIHGGVIAALIDTAGDLAVAQRLGGPVPTIDMKVDYLRPAAGAVIAVARARRIGRTVAVADVEVSDSAGKICALGRCVYAATIG
jgi:uncharacterized protein (TIGR00369 family)